MSNINVNDILASKWLAITDLPTEGIDLQILNVTREQVGEELEDKLAIHLNAGYKPMLCNRTNMRILASLYGPQTAGWISKTVNVYNDPTVSYAGRMTGGVRIRPTAQRQPTSQPQAPQASAQQYRAASGSPAPVLADPDLKDSIPW